LVRQVLAGQLGDHGGERADLVRCGLELRLLVLGAGVRAAGEPGIGLEAAVTRDANISGPFTYRC
jgi:hypothetical protein